MDDAILVEGLELAMAWGEDWLHPIQGRLSVKYPGLDRESLDRANAICQNAMREGHLLVPKCMRESGGKQKIAFATFSSELKVSYPWISAENLSRLFSQGCYYAWKDGELA